MNNCFFGRAILLGTIIGCATIPSEGRAGCLLDWLHKRRDDRQQVSANYAAAGCCGGAYCEQTVVRYVPQVAYRTVWQPVPVTSYRRTSYCNPATGLPMTCVQPCTSYTYQARRVPYTAYRPIYTTVPVTTNGWNANYAPASNCGNCSTGFMSPAAGSSPGYSTTYDSRFDSTVPPAYSQGTYADEQSGATPWRRVEPTPASPNSTYPDSGTNYDGDPGNLRPQPPRIQQNNYSRSVRRIPSTTRPSQLSDDYDPNYAYRDDRDRSFESGRNYSSRPLSDSRTRDSWQRFDSESSWRRDANNVDTIVDETPKRRPTDTRRLLDIEPVPNVDPPLNERRDLPDLLNDSADREANYSRPVVRWASHRIAMNEAGNTAPRRIRAQLIRPSNRDG